MSEKRNKRISVLVTEGEYGEIHRKALQANLSAGSYIRTVALSGEQMVFVDKSGIIVGHLGSICSSLQELKHNNPGICDGLGNVEKEVMELWHLLR